MTNKWNEITISDSVGLGKVRLRRAYAVRSSSIIFKHKMNWQTAIFFLMVLLLVPILPVCRYTIAGNSSQVHFDNSPRERSRTSSSI